MRKLKENASLDFNYVMFCTQMSRFEVGFDQNV
jgi:hypothetical protein